MEMEKTEIDNKIHLKIPADWYQSHTHNLINFLSYASPGEASGKSWVFCFNCPSSLPCWLWAGVFLYVKVSFLCTTSVRFFHTWNVRYIVSITPLAYVVSFVVGITPTGKWTFSECFKMAAWIYKVIHNELWWNYSGCFENNKQKRLLESQQDLRGTVPELCQSPPRLCDQGSCMTRPFSLSPPTHFQASQPGLIRQIESGN